MSDVQEVPPETRGHSLATGSVPKGYAAHLTRLFSVVPVPLVVMAVEEAAAKEGVAAKAVWRNVAKLAQSCGVLARHRPCEHFSQRVGRSGDPSLAGQRGAALLDALPALGEADVALTIDQN